MIPRRGRGRPRRLIPPPEPTPDADHYSASSQGHEPTIPAHQQSGRHVPTREAFEEFMAFWNSQANTQTQFPVGQSYGTSTPAPPPAAYAAPAEPSRPVKKLSKLVKEARKLGNELFSGTTDPRLANTWIRTIDRDLTDMDLEDDDKLKVAVRFLIDRADTWWKSVVERYSSPPVWDDFIREFRAKYLTEHHRREARQKFLNLKQEEKSVAEFEAQLREAAELVPELASDQTLCAKFEAGLNYEIRGRLPLSDVQSYEELVQMALRAEQFIEEGKAREQQSRKRGFNFGFPGFFNKGSSSGASSSVGSRTSFTHGPQASRFGSSASGLPFSERQNREMIRCQNCGRHHSGPCFTSPRCYSCG